MQFQCPGTLQWKLEALFLTTPEEERASLLRRYMEDPKFVETVRDTPASGYFPWHDVTLYLLLKSARTSQEPKHGSGPAGTKKKAERDLPSHWPLTRQHAMETRNAMVSMGLASWVIDKHGNASGTDLTLTPEGVNALKALEERGPFESLAEMCIYPSCTFAHEAVRTGLSQTLEELRRLRGKLQDAERAWQLGWDRKGINAESSVLFASIRSAEKAIEDFLGSFLTTELKVYGEITTGKNLILQLRGISDRKDRELSTREVSDFLASYQASPSAE